jgi:SAM-dependent methyltransferase
VNPAAPELPTPDDVDHPIGLGRKPEGLQGRRKNQIALLKRYGLEPSSHVLEIGCGVGWLAYDLAAILGPDGSYAGFDVSREAISWLNTNLAPRLPNFRFDLLDVANPRYRPKGAQSASEARFPYADDAFDLVCAYGVFMHIAQPGIENYLREITRTLQSGRPALVNFMAITALDETPRHGTREYVESTPGVYTNRPDREGWSLAFDDSLIRAMIDAAGLDIVVAEEGAWHGRRSPADGPVPGADLYVVTPRVSAPLENRSA